MLIRVTFIPSIIGLGHELKHAIDDRNGTLSGASSSEPNKYPNMAEESVVKFENILREGHWPNNPDRPEG